MRRVHEMQLRNKTNKILRQPKLRLQVRSNAVKIMVTGHGSLGHGSLGHRSLDIEAYRHRSLLDMEAYRHRSLLDMEAYRHGSLLVWKLVYINVTEIPVVTYEKLLSRLYKKS